MNRKGNLSYKAFTLFPLLFLLFVLSIHGVEERRADKITTFEELEFAIVQLQEKTKASPDDVEGYNQLAQLLLKKGEYYEAVQSLHKALNIRPAHIDSLLTLSGLYWSQYQFEKGEMVLKKVEALAPENMKTKLLLARYAIDRMDFDAAESIYQSVLEENQESAEAVYGVAEVLYWRDNFEESDKFIRQCLSIDPRFAKAFLLQSLIHRLRQENNEWKETGRKAVELAPFDERARTNLAQILMRGEGKLEEGYEQAKIALKINPYSYLGHSFLGNGWTPVYYKEQKIKGDEETVKQIKEILREGDECLLNREFDKAEAAFNKVLELDSSNITALIGKGTLNYHHKEYAAALDWFFRVLDINPDYGLAHYGVCQSLLRLRDRINIKFAEIEKEFAAKDAPEPPYFRDVFINNEQLDPDLQKILRFSVKPLSNYLEALKIAGATFYLIPFHKLLWESPYLARMKDTRTFDLRLWDDVKGCGGFHSTSAADWERDVKYHRFNVVAHEFAHQVHSFLPQKHKREIKRLFLKAKKERKTLDFYADSNEWEYFAVGVEAYVSEKKLADQKLGYGHTRKELLDKDPDLYQFIENLNQQGSYIESEIQAVIRKTQSLRGKDNMEKALEIYEEALSQYGRYPDLLEAIADIHRAKQDCNRAKEIHEQMIREFPDDMRGYIGLADDYFSIDRDASGAIQLLEGRLETHPDSVELFVKLGELYYYAGDIARMEESLKQAISLDPYPDPYSPSDPYFYLAKGLIEKEEYEEAKKWLNFSLNELDKNNLRIRAELAFVYLETGREREGQEHLDLALRASQWLPRVTEVKALYLARDGNTAEAQNLLEKQIERFSGRIETRIQLAGLIVDLEPDRARELLDEGLDILSSKMPGQLRMGSLEAPGHISESRLYTVYGTLLEKKGEIEQASDRHKKAWDLFRYNYSSAVSLVKLYKQMNREEEAKEIYERIKTLSAPESYLKKCENLLKEEQNEEASALFAIHPDVS